VFPVKSFQLLGVPICSINQSINQSINKFLTWPINGYHKDDEGKKGNLGDKARIKELEEVQF